MGNPLEMRGNRRWFIKGGLKAGGAIISLDLLSACATFPDLQTIAPTKIETKEMVPQEGDIAMVEGKPYLLRNKKRYPIEQWLDKYVDFTKMKKYGRKIFTEERPDLEKIPVGELIRYPIIIDPFTGELRANSPFGGEMNVYFGGMFTNANKMQEYILPEKDMFKDLKGKLEENGWGLLRNLYFTYGALSPGEYKATDTWMRNPEENVQQATLFLKKIKELFPLVQFNLIGHSLGAYFALEAARQNMDAINNLILLSGPLRGIEGTFLRRGELIVAKESLKNIAKLYIVDEEKVTGYLFDLWKNKKYQKELDDFSTAFVASGRGLVCAKSKKDKIIPDESATLKGAKEIYFEEEEITGLFEAHGSPLGREEVLEESSDRIGQNLALAAQGHIINLQVAERRDLNLDRSLFYTRLP